MPRDSFCKDDVTSEDDDTPRDMRRKRPTSISNVNISTSDHYALIVLYDNHHHGPHQPITKDQRSYDDVIINVTLTRTLFDLQNALKECDFTNHSSYTNSYTHENSKRINFQNFSNEHDRRNKTEYFEDKAGNYTPKTNTEVKSCVFDLSWESHHDVVIDFTSDVRADCDTCTDSVRKFRTTCHLRLTLWILLFGGAPLVLAIPITTAFSWFLCRKRRHNLNKVKHLSSHSEVKVRDDASLVRNEMTEDHYEGGSGMAIQDG